MKKKNDNHSLKFNDRCKRSDLKHPKKYLTFNADVIRLRKYEIRLKV